MLLVHYPFRIDFRDRTVLVAVFVNLANVTSREAFATVSRYPEIKKIPLIILKLEILLRYYHFLCNIVTFRQYSFIMS